MFVRVLNLSKQWRFNICQEWFRQNVSSRDTFERWFRSLVQLLRPDYCPSTGHNPGLLLASFLEITLRHLHFMGLRFCRLRRGKNLNARLVRVWCFDFTKTCILGSFFWTQRMLRVWDLGPSGTTVKEWDSLDLTWDYGAQRARLKAYMHRNQKCLNPIITHTHTATVTGLLQSKLTDLAHLNCYGNDVVIRENVYEY